MVTASSKGYSDIRRIHSEENSSGSGIGRLHTYHIGSGKNTMSDGGPTSYSTRQTAVLTDDPLVSGYGLSNCYY